MADGADPDTELLAGSSSAALPPSSRPRYRSAVSLRLADPTLDGAACASSLALPSAPSTG